MSDQRRSSPAGQSDHDPEAQPWVLCVTFTIKPEFESEFRASVSDVIDHMRHEETFISSSLCHDPTTPGRYFVFEVWRDRDEFFEVQVHRPYRAGYSERMQEMQESERTYAEFNQLRADSQIGGTLVSTRAGGIS